MECAVYELYKSQEIEMKSQKKMEMKSSKKSPRWVNDELRAGDKKIAASNATQEVILRLPDMSVKNEIPLGRIKFSMKRFSYDVICSGYVTCGKKVETILMTTQSNKENNVDISDYMSDYNKKMLSADPAIKRDKKNEIG